MEEAVGEYAEIGRPERCAVLKVSGLDESVMPEEVKEAIAKKGGCSVPELSTGGMHARTRGDRDNAHQVPHVGRENGGRRGKTERGLEPSKGEVVLSRRVYCFRCMGRGHAVGFSNTPTQLPTPLQKSVWILDRRMSRYHITTTPLFATKFTTATFDSLFNRVPAQKERAVDAGKKNPLSTNAFRNCQFQSLDV
ncbi:unnamed protein product [Chilo suppressalis]|uniref:Uncharacterized protein n=1 Tax=Chilo suppressalis TaxID=168631 RepID=A0ABN8APL6_CHISP|nr:unnamed protein product [Chilo suppressalis]